MRRQKERRLAHEARHDRLTGLPNRAYFLDQLKARFKLVKSDQGNPFSVLFIDVDNFKTINDTYGHSCGDELLSALAERLTGCLRHGDLCARLGGDEFGVIVQENESTRVHQVAGRILKQLLEPFSLTEGRVEATVSVGVAQPDVQHQTAEELLRDADVAMYRAKANGPGSYALHGSAATSVSAVD